MAYGLRGAVATILEPIIYNQMLPYIVEQIEVWGPDGFKEAIQEGYRLIDRMKERDPLAWRKLQVAKKYFDARAWDQQKLEARLFQLFREKNLKFSKQGWEYVQKQVVLLKEELGKR